jgi:hypothetical protein
MLISWAKSQGNGLLVLSIRQLTKWSWSRKTPRSHQGSARTSVALCNVQLQMSSTRCLSFHVTCSRPILSYMNFYMPQGHAFTVHANAWCRFWPTSNSSFDTLKSYSRALIVSIWAKGCGRCQTRFIGAISMSQRFSGSFTTSSNPINISDVISMATAS